MCMGICGTGHLKRNVILVSLSSSAGHSMFVHVYFFPFKPSVFEFYVFLHYNFHSALHFNANAFLIIKKKHVIILGSSKNAQKYK